MADDNEVKGTRGFVVTTEPTKKSKDFIAQYLQDKAVEQANLQAEREADVPDFRRTQRQTLDRADFRSDRADPDQTMGALGNKPSGMSEGVGNILEREKFTYRGPVDKSQGTDDNYVTTLYNKYLGREPDAGGSEYWKSRLAAGDSRAKVEQDILSSTEGQRKQQARIGGGTAFISDDFIKKFGETGSGVEYGDYQQDKDDMDSVTSTTDQESLNLKSLSDAYKDYLDEDDEGNTGDFLENYLANL
tara:strand:- start:63 stop:800 length:738 start_codon:yes stop_codon:yes gene_type:complete